MERSKDFALLKKLGARIAKVRKEKGLTQENLSDEIGLECDKANISMIESGLRNLTISSLQKIAKALKISLSELFKGID
jgi:transcriptional regulator with XRE-family HTH domain